MLSLYALRMETLRGPIPTATVSWIERCVRLDIHHRIGTGVVVDPHGYIVTNGMLQDDAHRVGVSVVVRRSVSGYYNLDDGP